MFGKTPICPQCDNTAKYRTGTDDYQCSSCQRIFLKQDIKWKDGEDTDPSKIDYLGINKDFSRLGRS